MVKEKEADLIEFLAIQNYNEEREIDTVFREGSWLGFATQVLLDPPYSVYVRLGFTSRLVSYPAIVDRGGTDDLAWTAQFEYWSYLRDDDEDLLKLGGEGAVYNWAKGFRLPQHQFRQPWALDGYLGNSRRRYPTHYAYGYSDGVANRDVGKDLYENPLSYGVHWYEGIWEANFFVLFYKTVGGFDAIEFGWSDPIRYLVTYRP